MRVYGYVRVSTDAQDLQRQTKQITDFCEVNKHELLYIYHEKISGATDIESREELSLLMQKTSVDADLVVISEMSRYSRQDDLVEVVYSIAKLLKRGLSLIFLDNKDKIYQANTTLGVEDIIILIAKAFANAEERKKIFERMYSRKIQLLRNNHLVLIGNNIPYGYKSERNPLYDPKKNNGQPKTFLVEDAYEKDIVIELFKRSAEGQTYKELQQYFESKNLRPIQKNRKRKEKYGDSPRRSYTVIHILTNRLYCGERTHKVRDFETNISIAEKFDVPAFVSKELFQKSLDAHKKNGEIIDKTHHCVNPLKGLIKCYCGSSMALATIRGKKVYTCFKSKKASKQITEKWCGNYGIAQELLMDIIVYDIKNGLNGELREKYDKATNDKLKEISNKLRRLESSFESINTKQRNRIFQRSNLVSAISESSDSLVRNTLSSALSTLEADIEKTKVELDNLSKEIYSCKEYQRNTLQHNQNLVVTDCNSDEFPNYLKSIIEKVVYRGYDVLNGLVAIFYTNGFISYYAVKKQRSWRCHGVLDAEINPISNEFIKFDRNGRVIVTYDADDKRIELDSVEKVRELVSIGRTVTIFGNKIRTYHQRFINI